jgi:hypothetical protein
MTIQEFIASLSHEQKLEALELLTISLAKDEGRQPPAWHEAVLKERTENPDPGPSLELDEAIEEVLAKRQQRAKDMSREG